MLDAEDAKELIDEAIERSEAAEERQEKEERQRERRFRDRVSILVGLFAVALAIVHVAAASNARDSVLRNVEASDSYNYMQAKIIRETVLKSAAEAPGTAPPSRDAMLKEAARLRSPDKAGHGIGQLQREGERLRDESEAAARRGERYELAETALQLAIVLLSIALVARSVPIVLGAAALAATGAIVAVMTSAGAV